MDFLEPVNRVEKLNFMFREKRGLKMVAKEVIIALVVAQFLTLKSMMKFMQIYVSSIDFLNWKKIF